MINRKLCLLIITLIAYSQAAYSSDFLLVMGAGGSASGPSTIFDDSIRQIGNYAFTSKSQVDIVLNGGHSTTENIIDNSFPKALHRSGFTLTDYNQSIERYKKMLSNNQIKTNDQLMIVIDTHGFEKNYQYKTHRIATSAGVPKDKTAYEESTLVDLDQLAELTKLAKKKGVRMAIIDESCYGGNSQALADENTCVISSSDPDHVTFNSFDNLFLKNLLQEKNLEDAFINARKNDIAPTFPMISTDAGKFISDLLYEKMSPYLFFDNTTMSYLESNSDLANQCSSDQQHSSLLRLIDLAQDTKNAMLKLNPIANGLKKVDFTELKNLLEMYKKNLDAAKTEMRRKKFNTLGIDEIIATDSLSIHYTWKKLLTTDFDKIIAKDKERLIKASDKESKIDIQNNIVLYTALNKKKMEITKSHPEFNNLLEDEEKIKKMVNATFELVLKIGEKEREVYDALYANINMTRAKFKNPCRDFKLHNTIYR
jgi:hypothetical protein